MSGYPTFSPFDNPATQPPDDAEIITVAPVTTADGDRILPIVPPNRIGAILYVRARAWNPTTRAIEDLTGPQTLYRFSSKGTDIVAIRHHDQWMGARPDYGILHDPTISPADALDAADLDDTNLLP